MRRKRARRYGTGKKQNELAPSHLSHLRPKTRHRSVSNLRWERPAHVRDGPKADKTPCQPMFALPSKAEICRCCPHVAYYSGKGRSLSDDKPATTFNAIEP
jgi:hypothetical protein